MVSGLPYRRRFFQTGGFSNWGRELRAWFPFIVREFGEIYTARGMQIFRNLVSNHRFAGNPEVVPVFYPDPDYPSGLRHIFDAPGVVWLRTMPGSAQRTSSVSKPGTTTGFADNDDDSGEGAGVSATSNESINPFQSNKRFVSIVRTRNPDPVSCEATVQFVNALPESTVIVSGLARGIDSVAHEAALKRGMDTLAVLGAGIMKPGPAENRNLWSGKYPGKLYLLSEFLPYTEARSYHFPRRNRIIAGLSDTTVLMQAPYGSGALISASFCLDEGRDLMVFDHPLLSAAGKNEGGRELLDQGALPLSELIPPERIHRIPDGEVDVGEEIAFREGLRSGRLRPLGQGLLFERPPDD